VRLSHFSDIINLQWWTPWARLGPRTNFSHSPDSMAHSVVCASMWHFQCYLLLRIAGKIIKVINLFIWKAFARLSHGMHSQTTSVALTKVHWGRTSLLQEKMVFSLICSPIFATAPFSQSYNQACSLSFSGNAPQFGTWSFFYSHLKFFQAFGPQKPFSLSLLASFKKPLRVQKVVEISFHAHRCNNIVFGNYSPKKNLRS